jgi:FMN-dependent NADH-azoreductase
MKILHLDSSITGQFSVSRLLTAETVATLVAQHRGAEVIYHDLAEEPAMHLSPAHLAAFQGGPVTNEALRQDLALGARYMEELFSVDVIVIGAPMYNHGLATQLKSWIDRVAVAGKTFRYTEHGPEGLLPPGTQVFIVSSKGGVYSGDSPAKHLEHSETHLMGVLGLMGLKNVKVIRAEGIGMGPEARQRAIDGGRLTIGSLGKVKQAA